MEICVDSFESAVNAESGGASRLELCSCLAVGGVTPSVGLIQKVKEQIKIPVFVLIRPRASDFHYDDSEIDVMIKDIDGAKTFNVDGFVVGALKCDGNVDEETCRKLINACRPAPVTFHRAIDMCQNPVKAVETIIHLGFDRILTSGHHSSAFQGKEIIKQMNATAAKRLSIMPGGGITEENLLQILEHTECFEAHASAKTSIESLMTYRNPNVNMGQAGDAEFTRFICDTNKVRNLVNIVKQYIQ
ncbi:hypothetical protein CHUAL_007634 [Chamberlinius hualienensis]